MAELSETNNAFPMEISVPHHVHTLHYVYEVNDMDKTYLCEICLGVGNSSLYSCSECLFYCHAECGMAHMITASAGTFMNRLLYYLV